MGEGQRLPLEYGSTHNRFLSGRGALRSLLVDALRRLALETKSGEQRDTRGAR